MVTRLDLLTIYVEVYQSVEGSQLKGFLKREVKNKIPYYLFDGAKEVILSEDLPIANPSHSLSLLVYSGLNPSIISLGSKFESVLEGNAHHYDLVTRVQTFFRGNSVLLPNNDAIDAQFKSFDQWTEVEEVKHISLWLLAAIQSIYGKTLPSSLEVGIPLPGELRPGRLDVVAKQSNSVICFEAKTSIANAIKDQRFIEQVHRYRDEIVKTAIEIGLDEPEPLIFLVTGSNENDLKSKDYKLIPTPVGIELLKICERHKIKFITVNAIWQMLAMHLVRPQTTLDLKEVLCDLNKNKEYLGLTSAGFITTARKIASPLVE